MQDARVRSAILITHCQEAVFSPSHGIRGREIIGTTPDLSPASMFSVIHLPFHPLSLLTVKYSDRSQRITLLAQLTSKQWTSLHWKLLRQGIIPNSALARDFDVLTEYYNTFHAVSPTDPLTNYGKSVIVFPDLKEVGTLFARVMSGLSELEEPVSAEVSALSAPYPPVRFRISWPVSRRV